MQCSRQDAHKHLRNLRRLRSEERRLLSIVCGNLVQAPSMIEQCICV